MKKYRVRAMSLATSEEIIDMGIEIMHTIPFRYNRKRIKAKAKTVIEHMQNWEITKDIYVGEYITFYRLKSYNLGTNSYGDWFFDYLYDDGEIKNITNEFIIFDDNRRVRKDLILTIITD